MLVQIILGNLPVASKFAFLYDVFYKIQILVFLLVARGYVLGRSRRCRLIGDYYGHDDCALVSKNLGVRWVPIFSCGVKSRASRKWFDRLGVWSLYASRESKTRLWDGLDFAPPTEGQPNMDGPGYVTTLWRNPNPGQHHKVFRMDW